MCSSKYFPDTNATFHPSEVSKWSLITFWVLTTFWSDFLCHCAAVKPHTDTVKMFATDQQKKDTISLKSLLRLLNQFCDVCCPSPPLSGNQKHEVSHPIHTVFNESLLFFFLKSMAIFLVLVKVKASLCSVLFSLLHLIPVCHQPLHHQHIDDGAAGMCKGAVVCVQGAA